MAKIPGAITAGTAPQPRVSPWEQLLIGLIGSAPQLAMGIMDQRRLSQSAGLEQQRFDLDQQRLGAADARVASSDRAAEMGTAALMGTLSQNPLTRPLVDQYMQQFTQPVGSVPMGFGGAAAPVPMPLSMFGGADYVKKNPQVLSQALKTLGPGGAAAMQAQLGSQGQATASMELERRNDVRAEAAAARAVELFDQEKRANELDISIKESQDAINRVTAQYAPEEARLRVLGLQSNLATDEVSRAATISSIASNYVREAQTQRQARIDERVARGLPVTDNYLAQLDELFPMATMRSSEIEPLVGGKIRGDSASIEQFNVLQEGAAGRFGRILSNYGLLDDDPVRSAEGWIKLMQTRGGDPRAALDAELMAVLTRHKLGYEGYASKEEMLGRVNNALVIHDAFLLSEQLPGAPKPVLNSIKDLERYLGVGKPSWVARMLAETFGGEASFADRAGGVDEQAVIEGEAGYSFNKTLSSMTPQERAELLTNAATAGPRLSLRAATAPTDLAWAAAFRGADALGQTGAALRNAAAAVWNLPGIKPRNIPGPGAPMTMPMTLRNR